MDSERYFSEKKWVLEFSPTQDCYHVDRIKKVVQINLELCRKDREDLRHAHLLPKDLPGYFIIYGPDTWDKVHDAFIYIEKNYELEKKWEK